MAATGTIALNANSLTVTGSGTKFTTEAQVGGALVTYIGNAPYTFVVGAINSDTSITLTANYQGSNVSGQSFSLIDRSAYTAITAELGARTAQAIRGLNYDKANWQQILTGSGNVTVNVPDGSQYTGPSWLSLANSLSGINDGLSKKANSADLGDAAKKNTGNASGTVAAGDDSRLNSLANKKGGNVTSTITMDSATNIEFSRRSKSNTDGNTAYWGNSNVQFYCGNDRPNPFITLYAFENVGSSSGLRMQVNYTDSKRNDYNFQDSGTATAISWQSTSDNRVKNDISVIKNPLKDMSKFRGCTWTMRTYGGGAGIGFIAQSIQKYNPDLVTVAGNSYLEDGSVVDDTLSINAGQIAAGLHHEAILNLMSIQRKALLTLSDPSLSDEDKQSALKELATLIPDESEYAVQ